MKDPLVKDVARARPSTRGGPVESMDEKIIATIWVQICVPGSLNGLIVRQSLGLHVVFGISRKQRKERDLCRRLLGVFGLLL